MKYNDYRLQFGTLLRDKIDSPDGAVNPSLSKGIACIPASSSKKYTCWLWTPCSSSAFAAASAEKKED